MFNGTAKLIYFLEWFVTCYSMYLMRYYVTFVIVDKLTNHIQKIIDKVREAFFLFSAFRELLLHEILLEIMLST